METAFVVSVILADICFLVALTSLIAQAIEKVSGYIYGFRDTYINKWTTIWYISLFSFAMFFSMAVTFIMYDKIFMV